MEGEEEGRGRGGRGGRERRMGYELGNEATLHLLAIPQVWVQASISVHLFHAKSTNILSSNFVLASWPEIVVTKQSGKVAK